HRDVAVGQLLTQRVVALERQRVVVRGDVGVGDRDVGGADDVPAVTVVGGTDRQVVGLDVVATVDQGREVAATPERDVADRQPGALGDRDDLVGLTGLGIAGDQVTTAVDRPATGERDVVDVVAVEHRVVEVAVPVVLVPVVRVALRRVVPGGRTRDGRTRRHVDRDVTLQVHRAGDLDSDARGHVDDPATGFAGSRDGPVERGRVVV